MISLQAHQFLNSFINFEIQAGPAQGEFFQLQRIEKLLEALGGPQKKLKCIHVAGSKGKGTTCAFAAHILKEAGYKVGLYTSPHLKDVNERIRILGKGLSNKRSGDIFPDCISGEDLEGLIEKYGETFEKFRNSPKHGSLTYFEALTALAFLYFEQEKVDFVVLETGLGGRLDATNVVDPCVCGLTPISLEHTAILGDTISKITAEKAAIIKIDKPVVVAPQVKEGEEVIKAKAREQNAKPYFVGKDIICQMGKATAENQIFSIQGLRGQYHLNTRLLGAHQGVNAAVAIGLVECLEEDGFHVSPEAISQGVKDAFWPCRFEVVKKDPWIVLDAAHTPESMQALGQTIQNIFPEKRVIFLLGVSSDKDIQGICQGIRDIASEVIFTRSSNPRAYVFGDKVKEVFNGLLTHDVSELPQAIKLALTRAEKDDVILIAGSIFLAAEARGILIG